MKGCVRLYIITIHYKRTDLIEGRCETLHHITIHHKRIDLDEGRCETLHRITIHHKRNDLDEGRCVTLHYIAIPCVFPCKVAAAGDERYLLCAVGLLGRCGV